LANEPPAAISDQQSAISNSTDFSMTIFLLLSAER